MSNTLFIKQVGDYSVYRIEASKKYVRYIIKNKEWETIGIFDSLEKVDKCLKLLVR